jgi:hypothetical protein
MKNPDAIEMLTVLNTERARYQSEADALNQKSAAFRKQLADLEAASAAELTALESATAALADALESGDPNAIGKARERAAEASRVRSEGQDRQTEHEALRTALASLEQRGREIGAQILSIEDREKELVAQRLEEEAARIATDYRLALETHASCIARAQALNTFAIQIGKPGNYAPPPYTLPTIIGENMGSSGRVVIDLGQKRERALSDLRERIRAEGFAGV